MERPQLGFVASRDDRGKIVGHDQGGAAPYRVGQGGEIDPGGPSAVTPSAASAAPARSSTGPLGAIFAAPQFPGGRCAAGNLSRFPSDVTVRECKITMA